MGIKTQAVWETVKVPVYILAFFAVVGLVITWAVFHFLSFAIVYGVALLIIVGDSVYSAYKRNLLLLQMSKHIIVHDPIDNNKTLEEDHY